MQPTPAQPTEESSKPDVHPAVMKIIQDSVERLVGADQYIERLAAALVRQQHQHLTGYTFAVPMQEGMAQHLLVPPQPTPDGTIVALTQVPLRGAQNVCLSVVSKDPTLVGQPVEEGLELDNYRVIAYVDEQPGNLLTRKHFELQKMHDPQAPVEVQRQLQQLPLGECAFFFLNFLRAAPQQ